MENGSWFFLTQLFLMNSKICKLHFDLRLFLPICLQREDGPAAGRRGVAAVHRARLQGRLGQLYLRHEERADLRHGPHTQR